MRICRQLLSLAIRISDWMDGRGMGGLMLMTHLILDAGAPLSAMDGVLVAVKDELDCLPYPTTGNVRND
jgi:hypothetical protein